MKFNPLSILILSSALMAPLGAFGDTLSAKKDGVEVLADPQKGSNVLKTLKAGETLEASERKGMFWEVKVGGGTGYVSVLNMKREAGGDGKLNDALRAAVTEGRDSGDNSRARSAVMGVRGLDASDETAFAGNVKPNLTLVFQMEDFYIPKQDLERHSELVMKEVEKKAQ
jgi:hypothetical protein